jgi:CHAT domain-containing protein/tetratricopeptide (TPR) repeat protein
MGAHKHLLVCLACLAGGALRAQQPDGVPVDRRTIIKQVREAQKVQKDGKLADAATRYRAALKQARRSFGDDDVLVADIRLGLGQVCALDGHLQEAISLYRSGQAHYHKAGKGLPVALVDSWLALVHDDLWNVAEAERLYSESYEALRELGSLEAYRVRTDHALLHLKLRRYRQAETALQECLQAMKGQPACRPWCVKALKGLGMLNDLRGARGPGGAAGGYDRAEKYYREALELEQSAPSPEPLVLAPLHRELAYVLVRKDRLEEAEKHLRRTEEILRGRLKPDHVGRSSLLITWALLRQRQGKAGEARKQAAESVRLLRLAFPAEHPDVAFVQHSLADVCAMVGGEAQAEAALHFQEARVAMRGYTTRILPALAESVQVGFLEQVNERLLDSALSLAVRNPADGELAERSAAWLTNAKGVLQEAVTVPLLLDREGRVGGDRRRQELKELRDLRKELAVLTWSPAGQTEEGPARYKRALAREEALAARLRGAGSGGLGKPWVKLEDVRASLPAGACLIDVCRVAVEKFDARSEKEAFGPPQYYAWVVPPRGRGKVQIVHLGDAEKVDLQVTQLREALAGKVALGMLKEVGRSEAYEELVEKPLRQASASVLHRLLAGAPVLKEAGVTTLILSPDSDLWLLPWHALLLPGDKEAFAVERYTIQYVVSGRDLVAAPRAGVALSAPLILAAPEHGRPEPLQKAMLWEAQKARAALAQASKGPGPRLLVGREADKRALQEAASPAVLYLITHGFFQDAAGGPANALDRCGLALACAAGEEAEGKLTGRQAAGLDLRGTDLVILSACKTGVGESAVGEQVRSLRQAFQMAGAKAVVSTLWAVPNKDSAVLMGKFLDNLARDRSKSRAQALCEAQRAMIRREREDRSAPHPFYWAGYTLTGR